MTNTAFLLRMAACGHHWYYSCVFSACLAQCTMTVNSPSAHRHKPLRIPSALRPRCLRRHFRSSGVSSTFAAPRFSSNCGARCDSDRPAWRLRADFPRTKRAPQGGVTLFFLRRRSTVKNDSSYSFQFNEMARPAGLEPAAFCLEVR
jgi:hypothetical protein